MTEPRLKVLLVEDNDDDAVLLSVALSQSHFTLERVDRLSAALTRLGASHFDVVLLDLSLPDSSGFETFTSLRDGAPSVAILVFTGLDDEALGLRTVSEGAQDFLVKGDAGTAVLVRAIRYAVERKRAEEITARVMEELRLQNSQMQDDLNLAREVQEAFLPQRYPTFDTSPQMGTLRFCHRYSPAGTVGGDFIDVSRLSSCQAGVLICDVMGHGVRAALVTAMLRAMVGEHPLAALEPGEMLAHLNRGLRGILKRSETPMFVSAFYLVVDALTGEVAFANAGHPSPLRLRAGQAQSIQPSTASAGRVLGLFDAATFTTRRAQLERGDRLLFFTDGIYEVDGAAGECFGQPRLRESVAKLSRLGSDKFLDGLVGQLQQFSSTGGFSDDACLLTMDFSEGEPKADEVAAPLENR